MPSMFVNRPHERILKKMLGPGGGVCSHVHQHRLASQSGQHDGDAGAFHPFEIKPRAHACRHDCPRVPRLTTASTVRSAISRQQTAIEQLGFFAQGLRRLLFHADKTL